MMDVRLTIKEKVMSTVTKYIVKDTFKRTPEYWLADGHGLTSHRECAYLYTKEELKVHEFKNFLKTTFIVLIPVQVEE